MILQEIAIVDKKIITNNTIPPASFVLRHLLIHAGRASQATLLGNKDKTVESLYLSLVLLK